MWSTVVVVHMGCDLSLTPATNASRQGEINKNVAFLHTLWEHDVA